MQNYLRNETVLKDCKIYQTLSTHRKGHISYHTPGHKNGAWDITELSFSDNLSCPRGCILEAEQDVARILGSEKSFLLTDGSTSGVFSMLYAAKLLGASAVAFAVDSHKSVYNACEVLGLTPLLYQNEEGMSVLNEQTLPLFEQADVLLFTSPNYYGKVAELDKVKAFCKEKGKLFLVDGAHGGHLHFNKKVYAGAYADMWVDGVHKSLPAFTQGAVVSAKDKKCAAALEKAVQIFRTTSPSYPIMASVEYAVKYPRNVALEERVNAYAEKQKRVVLQEDWTKLCALFGENAFLAEKQLESEGIYPEFCDGNVIMFYLSPAMQKEDLDLLVSRLERLFNEYPYIKKEDKPVHAPLVFDKNTKMEWVKIQDAQGRTCAELCGLFPPCTPLLQVGQRITKEAVALLEQANNVFGVEDGKIAVFTDKKE